MTIYEMIAVLKACEEGKQIQYSRKNKENWNDTSLPCWDFNTYDYRIKPEPKYRPYQSAEEVMDAMREHGSWIRNKYGFLQIVGIDNYGCRLGNTAIENLNGVFNDFTWPDGTPFGVKEG